MDKLILYNLPGCPYCKRVIEVLESKELKYETINVPPSKPERKDLIELSGQDSVPVLLIKKEDGSQNVIDDDDNIVPYLEENY
jgi:glutaredoxin 3